MKDTILTWKERASKSEFVASVWFCSARQATARPVLADPCISIALVKEGGIMKVVLRGPTTKPHNELLAPGYKCTAIRLRPGVVVQGFSAEKFIDDSLTIKTDVEGRFWFEGKHLQFPSFAKAERLIDQLHELGYLCHGVLDNGDALSAKTLSMRTYTRLIKRTTGFSPYRLHQLERMHAALRLLKQGMPVATVATELNFVDQSHLTHASKQFLGHTPKQLLGVPQLP